MSSVVSVTVEETTPAQTVVVTVSDDMFAHAARVAAEAARDEAQAAAAELQALFGVALRMVAVPASSASTGTAGDCAFDGDYFYLCVATNTWRRFALKTWS